MNSSPSMTELRAARERLTALALSSFRELGLPIPIQDEVLDDDRIQEYLSTNPDVTPEMITQQIEQSSLPSELAQNVVDLASPRGQSILNERVKEIGTVIGNFDPENRFARTCIGTVPGGGLDATSFKVEDSNAYAVVIPDGFFHLTNLLTKLVILLQPISPTPQGPVYGPSASFEQLAMQQHPYVAFRHRDLLDSFFFWGDPRAAVPYTQALPYQDRFAYLLVGTELFVLAHELAHVLLGHLDRSDLKDTKELELDADSMALKIVTQYFRKTTNFPVSRASMCGFLFLSMVRLWETGLETLTGESKIATAHSHPVSEDRFKRFIEVLSKNSEEETPPWYLHTHNSIRLVTEHMLAGTLEEIRSAAPEEALNARVLPRSHQYLGQYNITDERRWWREIAILIGSDHPKEHMLGLWLLDKLNPMAAIGLYRGIVDDDAAFRRLCEIALVKVEPLYASYIPRLKERYRETKETSEFDAYLEHLSIYFSAAAAAKLGDTRDLEPMDPRFFEAHG